MRVAGVPHRTASWTSEGAIRLIDQTALPFDFRTVDLRTVQDVAAAIETMVVRGAPAIGATAAFGLALSVRIHSQQGGHFDDVRKDNQRLASTRPTAVNLRDGLRRVRRSIDLRHREGKVDGASAQRALEAAQAYADEDAERCRRIGEAGQLLIPPRGNVLTHCNAGWLATVDWGTALAPIYAAQREGKDPRVWADETRPRGQGRSLTAWELAQEGVPCTVLVDGAAASLLRTGRIDLVITGSDRIAHNGDVANKIGTYPLALAARAAGVPFYVAAPYSTVDHRSPDGDSIPIEERSQDELLYVQGLGLDGLSLRVRVAAPGVDAYNPAFDVTPAELLAGYITEYGLLPSGEAGILRWAEAAREEREIA
jgi:S-methyl-5-thioribose-1-phosphate isomerase